MKKTFTLLAMTLAFFSNAQPVIQYTNTINASTGASGTVFVGAKPTSPGPSGAGVTWNFSTLTLTAVGTVSVMPPASTPFGTSFPSANWAAMITAGTNTLYSYNNIQPTFQDQIADNITATGGTTYTPNPKRHLVFPFNYGNSYSDTYQCVSCSPGSFTVTYDAYGTLIINGKTYNNVARVANLFGFNYYNYYNTNPVYSIFSFDTSPTSGPNATYFEVAGAGVGITENYVVNHMAVYPNPANDRVTIQNNNFMQVDFEIYDLLGNTIKTTEHLNQGETAQVDIANYPAGLYLLKYTDEFGNISFTKLVVE